MAKHYPNIFVLGRSQSGKTPFSHFVANRLNCNSDMQCKHIEALQWLRQHFQSGIDSWNLLLLDRQCVDDLTLAELERRPTACSDYVLENMDNKAINVIDGIFDSADFARLFRPATDVVVILNHRQSKEQRLTPTSYEGRLEGLLEAVNTLVETGALPPERLFVYDFAEFIEVRHSRRGKHSGQSANTTDCRSAELAHTGSTVAITAPSHFSASSLDLAMRDFTQTMERRIGG